MYSKFSKHELKIKPIIKSKLFALIKEESTYLQNSLNIWKQIEFTINSPQLIHHAKIV